MSLKFIEKNECSRCSQLLIPYSFPVFDVWCEFIRKGWSHKPLLTFLSQTFVNNHLFDFMQPNHCVHLSIPYRIFNSPATFRYPTHFPFSIICPLPLSHRCFAGVSQVFRRCFAGVSFVFHGYSFGHKNHSLRP